MVEGTFCRLQESSTLCVADCEKNPPNLLKLIQESEWDAGIAMCKDFPTEAAKWGVRRGLDRVVEWRRLPIHEACIRQAPLALIEVLLTSCPECVKAKDHSNRLALHHACFYGASTEVVRRLLLAFPEAIHAIDTWKKTPLCVAQGSCAENRDDILKDLERGSSHWTIKIEEQKWIKDRDERIETLKKAFQEERDAYDSRIQALELRIVSEKKQLRSAMTSLEVSVESLQKENGLLHIELSSRENGKCETHRAMQEKLEQLTAKLVDGAVVKLERERKLAYAITQTAQLQKECEVVNTLRDKIKASSSDMSNASQKVCELEKELSARKMELSELEISLVNATASEGALQEKIHKLNDQLENASAEIAAARLTCIEVKADRDSKVAQLNKEIANLTRDKLDLEGKAKEDGKTIMSLGKSSADYYLQSSERLAELEVCVFELTAESEAKDIEHQNATENLRKERLSLDQTFTKSCESYQIMEEALRFAVEEHNRLGRLLQQGSVIEMNL